MKLKTLLKGAGRYLYRTAPGKPWKARKDDQLRFLMPILTPQGPLDIVVPNLRERKLLHQYDLAIRMFRAGADGAEAALKAFEGKTVGGHTLMQMSTFSSNWKKLGWHYIPLLNSSGLTGDG
jgi:hypothetical protein